MDALSVDGVVWVLVLTLPIMVVLVVALCSSCQDHDLPGGPAIGDYEPKPPSCAPPFRQFELVRPSQYPSRARGPHSFPTEPRINSLPVPSSSQPPQSRTASSAKTEDDNESLPSYENQVTEPSHVDDNKDDDYTNDAEFPGYVEVLPDSPTPELAPGTTTSTESIDKEYENMPETEGSSLGGSLEYVNVPGSTAEANSNATASEQESEDDGPDYENLHNGAKG